MQLFANLVGAQQDDERLILENSTGCALLDEKVLSRTKITAVIGEGAAY
jgi:hypothetical protein